MFLKEKGYNCKKFINFTVPRNNRRDTNKTQKSPFSQLETAKNHSAEPETSQKTKNWEKIIRVFFLKMFPLNHIVPKTLRKGPFGLFNIHSGSNGFQNIKQNERGPFEDN